MFKYHTTLNNFFSFAVDDGMVYIKQQRMQKCITDDDYDSVDRNLPLQHYVALLLFAEEDRDFANNIINQVETFGLKVSSNLCHSV